MTKEYRGFAELRKHGLRVTKGIDTRGKSVKVRFEAPSQINNTGAFALYNPVSIGRYSFVRSGTLRYIDTIGRYCSIGPGVTIGEGEHPTNWLSTSPSQYAPSQFGFYPPEKELAKKRASKRTKDNHDGAVGLATVGNDVWIGAGVTIRRGVKIGDGAIIAGGAFVNKDVLPYEIVAGLPARHIRFRFPTDVVSLLVELRWWRFDINDLAGVPFDKIRSAIDDIREREARGVLKETPIAYREVSIHTKGYHDLKL